MTLPARIYRHEVLEQINKYLNSVKTGKDIFFFGYSAINVYLSDKNLYAYINHQVDLKTQSKIKDALNTKYDRAVILKKTLNGYIIPDNFIFNHKGVFAIKETLGRNGEVRTKYLHIFDKWVFIKAMLYSKYHEIYQYEVEACNPTTLNTKTSTCKMEDLSKWSPAVSFLTNRLGVNTEEGYKKEITTFFNKFINENSNRLPQKVTVPNMGWNEDMTEFAPYSNKIHIDCTGDTSGYLKNTIKSFRKRGNEKAYIEKLTELTLNNIDADIIFSTALAAPLLKPLGIRSFAVNFFGKSGTFKSLLSKFSMAAFGNPEKISSAGNHTKNVLIEKLSRFHNLPFYVDEMTEKSFDIYSIGNQMGRQRLSQSGQIQELTAWETVMFCTSEISLDKESNKAGEINRLLCLQVNCVPPGMKNKIKQVSFAREMYLFMKKNYGLLGYKYIHAVKKNLPKLHKLFNNIFESLTSISNNKLEQHVNMISIICLANYLYRFFFFKEKDMEYSIEMGKYILNRISTKKELDPALKLYNAIIEYYMTYKTSFIHPGFKEIKTGQCRGEVKYTGDILFYNHLLKEYLEKNGFNWNELRTLEESGLIERRSGRIKGEVNTRVIINLNKNIDMDQVEIEEERIAIQEENITILDEYKKRN